MSGAPTRLVHATGEPLILDPTRLLLGFGERQNEKALADRLRGLGLVLEEGDLGTGESGIPQRVNHSPTRIWVRTDTGRPIDAKALDALGADWVAGVYQSHRVKGRAGLLSILPTALLLRPARPGTDLAPLERRYGLTEVTEKSKYLGDFRYYRVTDPRQRDALDLREELLAKEKELVSDVRYETIPLIVPTAMIPNDTHFPLQWNMTQVHAGGAGTTAWDITTGVATVVVCVLDEGCDRNHVDLAFSGPGINLGTMAPPGDPTGNHGTACAGIVAALIGNGAGVAGMAGGCGILPAAFDTWSDVEVAAGINFATAAGARVISMSFGWDAWDHAIIDPAIQTAFNSNVVMCVATHNYNGAITYPATNPLVMAVGASDQADNRKTFTSPDGECWGSDFGPQISVVAPGVRVPTTDRSGNGAGYNQNNGGAMNWACVNYATSGDAAGDYIFIFDGTSAATPHVAGLAALLISHTGTLTNVQVRNAIEQTAEKVGTVPYVVTPGKPNGTWNQEMGYGRINAYQALRSISKHHFKEIKDLIDTIHKNRLFDEVYKHDRGGKEKEHIDEIKGVIGYENPEIFDPRIYERIITRLDRLEETVRQGRPFIRAEERPEVRPPAAPKGGRKK